MRRIRLGEKEREGLLELARGSGDGRRVRRGQALLWLDRGEPVGAVAARLGVTRQTIWHWVRRWPRRRGQPLEQVLGDAPRGGRPAAKRGPMLQLLPGLLKESPQAWGYRPVAWTLPLLQQHFRRAQGLIVSRTTVRRALRDLGYRYKRPRYVLARRSPTWRQAKGGSNEGCGEGDGPPWCLSMRPS